MCLFLQNHHPGLLSPEEYAIQKSVFTPDLLCGLRSPFFFFFCKWYDFQAASFRISTTRTDGSYSCCIQATFWLLFPNHPGQTQQLILKGWPCFFLGGGGVCLLYCVVWLRNRRQLRLKPPKSADVSLWGNTIPQEMWSKTNSRTHTHTKALLLSL